MPIKRIGLGLDFDGCLLTTRYVFPFTPYKVGDIRENTSIVDTNEALCQFVLQLCREHSELEVITLLHFSARQSLEYDAMNSQYNKSESYFLAMTKIKDHLCKQLKSLNSQVRVELNGLLMADIYNEREHGYNLKKAFEALDCSFHGMGMVKIKDNGAGDSYLDDDSKVSFVFAHVHAIDADVFYYLDDKRGILETIDRFYRTKMGSSFVPDGVKVILCHYDNGKLIEPNLSTIMGSGNRCEHYGSVLRAIQSNCYALPLMGYLSSVEGAVKHFSEIFHREMGAALITANSDSAPEETPRSYRFT